LPHSRPGAASRVIDCSVDCLPLELHASVIAQHGRCNRALKPFHRNQRTRRLNTAPYTLTPVARVVYCERRVRSQDDLYVNASIPQPTPSLTVILNGDDDVTPKAATAARTPRALQGMPERQDDCRRACTRTRKGAPRVQQRPPAGIERPSASAMRTRSKAGAFPRCAALNARRYAFVEELLARYGDDPEGAIEK
jgi:hypothetical protein